MSSRALLPYTNRRFLPTSWLASPVGCAAMHSSWVAFLTVIGVERMTSTGSSVPARMVGLLYPSIRQSYARVFHTEELEPKDGWNYYLRVMYDNLEDEKGKIAAYLNYQEVNYAVFRSGRGMDETMEKGGFARIWQENDLEIWYNPNIVETRTKDQGYGPA